MGMPSWIRYLPKPVNSANIDVGVRIDLGALPQNLSADQMTALLVGVAQVVSAAGNMPAPPKEG